MTKEEKYLQDKGHDLFAIRHPQDLNQITSEINLYDLMRDYTAELTEEVEEREIQLQGYKDCLQIRESTIEEQRKTIEELRKMIKN